MLIKAKVCLRSGVLSAGGQMSSVAAKRREAHSNHFRLQSLLFL